MRFLGRTHTCREGVRKGKVQLKFQLGRDGKDIKGLLKVPYQQKTGQGKCGPAVRGMEPSDRGSEKKSYLAPFLTVKSLPQASQDHKLSETG